MAEKLEQSKEFIEEVEQLKSSYIWLYGAMDDVYVNPSRKFPALKDFLFGDTGSSKIHAENQLMFAKIWSGEIELVEKKPKYVIYQIDDECNPWLLGIGVYGTLKNLPDFNANQPCEHGDYANKNCHFDQKFAFAMRDTGEFKIEEVVE